MRIDMKEVMEHLPAAFLIRDRLDGRDPEKHLGFVVTDEDGYSYRHVGLPTGKGPKLVIGEEVCAKKVNGERTHILVVQDPLSTHNRGRVWVVIVDIALKWEAGAEYNSRETVTPVSELTRTEDWMFKTSPRLWLALARNSSKLCTQDLSGVNIDAADFSAADMLGCKFSRQDTQNVSFRRANLNWVETVGSKFTNCNFDRALMSGSVIAHSDFYDTRFTHLGGREIRVRSSNFHRCDFRHADFHKAKFECCSFTECNFSYAAIPRTVVDSSVKRCEGIELARKV